MECKWCSYNYEQQRIKAIKNPIKWFLAWLDWKGFSREFHRDCPKCMHPEVMAVSKEDERVFGELPPARILLHCSNARSRSVHGSHYNYLCCEKEGKYWEAKDE
jgi:hypothetical protein